MPIDPGKMSAFVNEGAPPEGEIMPEEGGDGEEESGEERFDGLITLLGEFRDDVTDAFDEMDPDVLSDHTAVLEPDDAEILQTGFDSLDRRLQKTAKACLGGISPEQAEAVATRVADLDLTDDPERLGGWLYRVGALIGGPPMPEDEEGMGDEELMEGEEE